MSLTFCSNSLIDSQLNSYIPYSSLPSSLSYDEKISSNRVAKNRGNELNNNDPRKKVRHENIDFRIETSYFSQLPFDIISAFLVPYLAEHKLENYQKIFEIAYENKMISKTALTLFKTYHVNHIELNLLDSVLNYPSVDDLFFTFPDKILTVTHLKLGSHICNKVVPSQFIKNWIEKCRNITHLTLVGSEAWPTTKGLKIFLNKKMTPYLREITFMKNTPFYSRSYVYRTDIRISNNTLKALRASNLALQIKKLNLWGVEYDRAALNIYAVKKRDVSLDEITLSHPLSEKDVAELKLSDTFKNCTFIMPPYENKIEKEV